MVLVKRQQLEGGNVTPNAIVAKNVSDLRRRFGMTQRELADAMLEQAGVKMDPATIARLEGGERRITVEDVFSIAAALKVSPVDLLLPREPIGDLEVGDIVMSFRSARYWVRRWEEPPGADPARFREVELPDVALADDLEHAADEMRMATHQLEAAEISYVEAVEQGDPEVVERSKVSRDAARDRADMATQRWAKALQRSIKSGW